jgi:hypothetical protein
MQVNAIIFLISKVPDLTAPTIARIILSCRNVERWWSEDEVFGGKNSTCATVKKRKINAVPLQAWTGPQGSRRSRFPDF